MKGQVLTMATPTEAKNAIKSQHQKEQLKERYHKQKAAIHTSSAPAPPPPSRQSARPVTYQNHRYDCVLCVTDKHPLFLCPRFGTMTVDQRIEHIKAHHLCFNCLAPGHKTADCRSHGRCRTCQQKHNSLVHQDQPPRPQPPSTVSTNAVANLPTPSIQSSLTMTSQVMLSGPSGNKLVVRALLDSGSTVSLISSKAANTQTAENRNTPYLQWSPRLPILTLSLISHCMSFSPAGVSARVQYLRRSSPKGHL